LRSSADKGDEIAKATPLLCESSKRALPVSATRWGVTMSIVPYTTGAGHFRSARDELELRNKDRLGSSHSSTQRRPTPGRRPNRTHRPITSAARLGRSSLSAHAPRSAPMLNRWADTPGLWSAEQIPWAGTGFTDAVHEKGGFVYAHLWHTGSMFHIRLLSWWPRPMSAIQCESGPREC